MLQIGLSVYLLTITKFNPLNFVQPLKQVTQNYIFLYGKIKYYISILFAIKMMTTHPAWFMDEGKITNSTGLKYSKNMSRMLRCLLFLKLSTFFLLQFFYLFIWRTTRKILGKYFIELYIIMMILDPTLILLMSKFWAF